MSAQDRGVQDMQGRGLPGAPGTEAPTRPLLRRTTGDDEVIAGVAGGIGRYLGIDPVLVRIMFVVLALAGGPGVIAYLVGWLAIPEEDPAAPPEAGTMRGASNAGMVAGVALLVIGSIAFADAVLPALGAYMWPLLLVGAGVLLIIGTAGSRGARR